MRTYLLSSIALVATLSLVGCSDDDGGGTTNGTDTGMAAEDTSTTTDTGSDEDTGGTVEDTGMTPEVGGDALPPLDTGTGDTGGDTMVAAPTFSQVWTSTLRGKCASCHDNTAPAGALNMTDKATAYSNLVGKPAAGPVAACGGKGTRVVAGNAAMSILYQKVTTPTCGGRMPPVPANPLSMAETNRIRDWINAGALNN